MCACVGARVRVRPVPACVSVRYKPGPHDIKNSAAHCA